MLDLVVKALKKYFLGCLLPNKRGLSVLSGMGGMALRVVR